MRLEINLQEMWGLKEPNMLKYTETGMGGTGGSRLSPCAPDPVDSGSYVPSRFCPGHRRLVAALKGGTATLGHCLPAPSDSPIGALAKGAGISTSWPSNSKTQVFTGQITIFHYFILNITLSYHYISISQVKELRHRDLK